MEAHDRAGFYQTGLGGKADLRLLLDLVGRHLQIMVQAAAPNLEPAPFAGERQRDRQNRFKGIALLTSPRPGVAFAARYPDAEVTKIVDQSGRDSRSVVAHHDQPLVHKETEARHHARLLAGV